MKNTYKTTDTRTADTPATPVRLMHLVSFLLFLSVVACSKTPPCTDKDGHEWGGWVDQWSTVNDAGYMRQLKHCIKCNAAQSGLHK